MKTELADMAQVLRVLIDDGIQLTVTANAEGHVKADRAEFEQVVTSLVLNARDAMPDGGKIAIETADGGDQVMLSVSDTGAGMDEETQSRLFEPFFTTKSRGLGAGLGLSTTYAIVKRIGGNMRVSTELDRGTTFQIYLPRVQGESQDPTPREATGGSETIMLVEDEPLVRRLSSTVLREKGYRVLEAAGGPEALRIAREHDGDIQLLIVDVVMPRMSGREVADRLTSQRPGMKILFTTGDAKDAIEHHGVMDDGFVLLQKPFTPKALAWKVREVLDVR
jgi:CheY-like chemotaxis protein/uncharacterized protein YfcZ (UPF0381/DUF406 family)